MSTYVPNHEQTQQMLLSAAAAPTALRGNIASRLTNPYPPAELPRDSQQLVSEAPHDPMAFPAEDAEIDNADYEDFGYDAEDDSRDNSTEWCDQSFAVKSPADNNYQNEENESEDEDECKCEKDEDDYDCECHCSGSGEDSASSEEVEELLFTEFDEVPSHLRRRWVSTHSGVALIEGDDSDDSGDVKLKMRISHGYYMM
ncbi:hypothetical protein Dda_3361 [Drechslerella dactyloides]|uniref:Uncharacterized protein n=1 Tax=Drechslerella dactyloides TaxID=74499 RepID=A0AAD6J1F8_DREDA|nr:hypothetical protein Dda_3361 [Drechslerella dactyloides]